MKGVILAGGTGSRLFPLTKVTNKHLLPVYNKPMIYYPLECMVNAGIDEVLLVTGGNNAGDFIRLLGNGREFGLKELNYTYQEGAGGIAEALGLAEDFVDGGSFCLILGDNIVEYSIGEHARRFRHQGQGAKILLAQVENPRAYGVRGVPGRRGEPLGEPRGTTRREIEDLHARRQARRFACDGGRVRLRCRRGDDDVRAITNGAQEGGALLHRERLRERDHQHGRPGM
jgi:hypothetical protein